MGYVLDSKFWTAEKKSKILETNFGYVTPDNAKLCVSNFAEIVDQLPTEFLDGCQAARYLDVEKTGSPEFDRIFREDAMRTFYDSEYRENHIKTLNGLYMLIGDYHQGLGFLVAYLSLFLAREQVLQVAYYLSLNCCKGYYKFENEAFLRDCKVFDRLNAQMNPKLAAHLAQFVTSGQYLSKYWIGVCVHVFPFCYVNEWIERLVSAPKVETLLQLALAIMKVCYQKLLSLKSSPQLTEFLRFDKEKYGENYALDDSSEAVYSRILGASEFIELDSELIEKLQHEAQLEIDEANRGREEAIQYSDDCVFSDEDDWAKSKQLIN